MSSETQYDTEAVLPNPRDLQEIFTGKEVTFTVQGERYIASAPKTKVNPLYQSGGTRLERELSTGTQIYQTHEELYPLTQPVVKLEAMIQCSGEAQYLNDTPPIPGELFGAFVLAEAKPLSTVKNVDTSEALKMPGVRAYVNYKDVPGSNSFSPPNLSPTKEVLFVEDIVLYNGQPMGLILADTRDHALNAAAFVKVTYNATTDIPAFNVKDVLTNNQQSRITNVANVTPTRTGDDVKQVIQGTFEVEGQYHFTMETQSCICIPTDDGGYDVNSATQWMDNVQASAALALNLPMNKINVAVKRLGGAYGAKILRASLVSTACAIASHKVQKPVRIQLPLIENMKMLGKRPPTTFQFEVGVDENGVIQYMDNTYYQDYGLSGVNENFSPLIPRIAQAGYVFDTWKWNGNRVQTDMPGNAFTRGPVTTETIGMIETLMEQISYAVNKDPVQVRLANLRPEESVLSTLTKDLMTWSDYDQRVKAAQDFNTGNRWMKKGLSLVMMNYPFAPFGPWSVFMSVYAQDGTVAISHGGIECGQGINTKIAQVCAYTLGIPLDMVSIKPSSSLNAPNNFATGGSMTSEAVCYGIIGACKEIQRRLEPVPGAKDIPADFRIQFRQDSTNPGGVLNSKAIAEPPLALTVAIPLAIRRALASAREEADSTAPRFVPNVGPTTVEFTYLNALNNYKTYSL
ncbi:Aldehyde oxidase 3 [Carabus blaptoides fortunei]